MKKITALIIIVILTMLTTSYYTYNKVIQSLDIKQENNVYYVTDYTGNTNIYY